MTRAATPPRAADDVRVVTRDLRQVASSLRFPFVAHPRVSVVMCGRDRPELTIAALRALADNTPPGVLEVILVDDASRPATRTVLDLVDGITLMSNAENLGFLRSTNRGIDAARGEHVLLLNNDTEVREGWLPPLLALMDDPTVGAVGCRLLNPDGTVQEAGVTVWDDGTGSAQCFGGEPDDERWLSTHEVDYASGAALLVRAGVLREIGGLDERFAPAFYEDTDLCFAIRERGFRVLISPESNVMHRGGASYGTDSARGSLPSRGKIVQYANRPIFAAKWARQLASDHLPPVGHVRVPFRGRNRPRVLVADSWVPAHDRDSGGLRMTWIIRLLMELGADVTLWAIGDEPRGEYAAMFRREGVEVWTGKKGTRYLSSRPGSYDVALVSRPDVAVQVIPLVRKTCPRAAVVYDSVDVHFQRVRCEQQLGGGTSSLAWESLRDMEERVCESADAVAVVSHTDAHAFAEAFPGTDLRFHVLSNVLPPWPTSPVPAFEDRSGFLFIGGYRHPPNADAVVWFVRHVWPRLASETGADLTLLGESPTPEVMALAADARVSVPGYVPDVTHYFDSARLFVCPLRYGSGVKGKVNQALSAGLPIVATSVSLEGMDLTPSREALVCDDPDNFAESCLRVYRDRDLWTTLSVSGHARSAEWSQGAMRAALRSLLEDLLPGMQRMRLRD